MALRDTAFMRAVNVKTQFHCSLYSTISYL